MDPEAPAIPSGPNAAQVPGVPQTDVDRGDAELARSAAAGDAAAFGVLYDRHFTAVYRYALARASDRMEAEDVTSETFTRALRSLPRYEPRAPFAAWLIRIARNAIVDRSRRDTRRDARERAVARAASVDPEAHALARGEARELRAALERLSDLQRDVLTLRFFADLSTEEICAALGKGPSTIRGIQHRALAALRRELAAGA
ncbi:MAG: RNA polymerase sigma factor [Candidatus Limnocylindria bacterium]